MDKSEQIVKIIKDAGLSEPLAKTYYALLTSDQALTPARLATKTGETRTNTYALLTKLQDMNLVQLQSSNKKSYTALPPANLEIYVEKQRREASLHEQNLKNNLSALTDIFYANNSAPGSKTAFGLESVKEVYRDILRVKQDVYLIYIPVDDALGDFVKKYRAQCAQKNIHTYAITMDNARARKNYRAGNDQRFLMDRVVIPADAYTAPVVFMVYGPKIAMISYENADKTTTTTITSPALAESMKQIIIMLRNLWRDNYPQFE